MPRNPAPPIINPTALHFSSGNPKFRVWHVVILSFALSGFFCSIYTTVNSNSDNFNICQNGE